MFTREGSSCNNNRRLTVLVHEKLKTFEAALWPPPKAQKPRTDARLIVNVLLFFCCRKCKISFMRRTAFVLAMKVGPCPFLRRKFSASLRVPWQKWQVTDSLIFSCSLSPAAIAWLRSFAMFPDLRKRFFSRNFWSPCIKCWCRNRRVAFSAWLLVQLLQPLLLVEERALITLRWVFSPIRAKWFFQLLRPCHYRRKRTRPLVFFQRHLNQALEKIYLNVSKSKILKICILNPGWYLKTVIPSQNMAYMITPALT